MTVNEICERAARNVSMNDKNIALSELMLYHTLRALYERYNAQLITVTQAKADKAHIISRFEILRLQEKIVLKDVQRWRKYQVLQSDATKHGCEICKKIVRVLSGMEDESVEDGERE